MDFRQELLSEGVLTLDGLRWSDGMGWCELQTVRTNGRDMVNIRYLWASQCGKGHGTALLQKILRVADRLGTTLYLEATPFWRKNKGNAWCFETIREGGLNKAQLQAWYAKHGFKAEGKDVMIRKAIAAPPHDISVGPLNSPSGIV